MMTSINLDDRAALMDKGSLFHFIFYLYSQFIQYFEKKSVIVSCIKELK